MLEVLPRDAGFALQPGHPAADRARIGVRGELGSDVAAVGAAHTVADDRRAIFARRMDLIIILIRFAAFADVCDPESSQTITPLTLRMLGPKLSAGGVDVAAERSADRYSHSIRFQRFCKEFYGNFFTSFVNFPLYLVDRNEVDVAKRAAQPAAELVRAGGRIVDAADERVREDVYKRQFSYSARFCRRTYRRDRPAET